MSVGGLILLSLALGVAAWLFFLWTVKSGQYEDPEGPKYRMLEDEEGSEQGSAEEGRGPRGAGEGDSPPRWTGAERSDSEQAPAEQGRGPAGSADGEGRHAPRG